MPILALFILLPLIEIALFVLAGAEIGFWATAGLTVLTSLIGMLTLRLQGALTLRSLQEAQQGLGDPAAPMAHGALRYLAGILLLLPGFATDGLGLLLLLPPIRQLILHRLGRHITILGTACARPRHRPAHEDVIDGEATEIFPEARPLPRNTPSGWTKPQD